jgi:hypothetical protein
MSALVCAHNVAPLWWSTPPSSSAAPAQFVLLKFPGLPGYLSFEQLANTLRRPDIVAAILTGEAQAAPPSLSPPPRSRHGRSGNRRECGAVQGVVRDLRNARPRQAAPVHLRAILGRAAISGRAATITETVDIPPKARWLTAVASDTSGSEGISLSWDELAAPSMARAHHRLHRHLPLRRAAQRRQQRRDRQRTVGSPGALHGDCRRKGTAGEVREGTAWGRRLSSAIVNAITGEKVSIDTNNNGVIELRELYGKIKPTVLTEVRGDQTPWLARADRGDCLQPRIAALH